MRGVLFQKKFNRFPIFGLQSLLVERNQAEEFFSSLNKCDIDLCLGWLKREVRTGVHEWWQHIQREDRWKRPRPSGIIQIEKILLYFLTAVGRSSSLRFPKTFRTTFIDLRVIESKSKPDAHSSTSFFNENLRFRLCREEKDSTN